MGFGNVRLNGAMAMSKWRVAGTLCKAIQAATISACRLFRNIEQVQKLSELGVLFLLFEMGLELSLDRLKVSPHFMMIRPCLSAGGSDAMPVFVNAAGVCMIFLPLRVSKDVMGESEMAYQLPGLF